MKRPYSSQDATGLRPPVPLAWIGVFFAVCVLGASVELLWGDKIVNWLEGGMPARERASIITSYYRAVESGNLPQPASASNIMVYHLDKNAPYRMAVRVRTQSGETRQFQLVRPPEAAGTNWGFRAN
ncbi:MAG: hypothetical protein ABSE90_11625 [Verrucomicrobiota bacterium]|jgi:hypothetical protein